MKAVLTGWAHEDPRPAFVYEAYATQAPEEAAALALQLTNDLHRLDAVRAVAGPWAMADPDAAWSWSASIQDEAARSRAQCMVTIALALHDPRAAVPLLDRISPGPERQTAVRRVVAGLGRVDPAGAFDLVISRDQPSARRGVIPGILEHWAETDHDAAGRLTLRKPYVNLT